MVAKLKLKGIVNMISSITPLNHNLINNAEDILVLLA